MTAFTTLVYVQVGSEQTLAWQWIQGTSTAGQPTHLTTASPNQNDVRNVLVFARNRVFRRRAGLTLVRSLSLA